MTERPQILLVPSWSEVHWGIEPELEEWADVASYVAAALREFATRVQAR